MTGSEEVSELRSKNAELKQLVAEVSLKNRMLKKPWRVWNKDKPVYEILIG